MSGGGTLEFPRCVAGGENGAEGVRSKWHDHFADSPDVLKGPGVSRLSSRCWTSRSAETTSSLWLVRARLKATSS